MKFALQLKHLDWLLLDGYARLAERHFRSPGASKDRFATVIAAAILRRRLNGSTVCEAPSLFFTKIVSVEFACSRLSSTVNWLKVI